MSTRMAFTTVAVVGGLLLAAAAGPCGKQIDETETFDYHLKHSHIYGKTEIRIGVPSTAPLLGFHDEKTGDFSGFDIEVARIIAEELGYKIVYVPIGTSDRVVSLQQGTLDMVVATFSITEERKKQVRFAGPYLVVTQEVMVPVAKLATVQTVDDLKRVKVCASGSSSSEDRLKREGITPVVRSGTRQCVDAMLRNEVDALSSDRSILESFRFAYPGQFAIIDMPWDFGEEIGVGVPLSDPSLQALVSDILLRNYEQGRQSRWQAAYDRTLGLMMGPLPQPAPKEARRLIRHDDRSPAS